MKKDQNNSYQGKMENFCKNRNFYHTPPPQIILAGDVFISFTQYCAAQWGGDSQFGLPPIWHLNFDYYTEATIDPDALHRYFNNIIEKEEFSRIVLLACLGWLKEDR